MRNGFTLIDLLAIIAVIVILAYGITILNPPHTRIRPAANRSKCTNNMKQIAVGLDMFSNDYGGKYPLEISSKEAGDVAPSGASERPAITQETIAGSTLKKVGTIVIPDITFSGITKTEIEGDGPSFQRQASILLFARLYGAGADWATSGRTGVITDSTIFECPLAAARIYTRPTGTRNLNLKSTQVGDNAPLYGANLLITNSSVPNAISAADLCRTGDDQYPSDAERKGINHVDNERYWNKIDGFNYLYRDGHVTLITSKNVFNATLGNRIDDSSMPTADSVVNGAPSSKNGTTASTDPKNVEAIFLW